MDKKTGLHGYVVLTCEFHKEGRYWVATCVELGTSTFARTLPDAERRLHEAITLHLETLEEVSELERFFTEHNIVLNPTKPRDVQICVTPTREDAYFRPYIHQLGELIPA